jgi:acyl-homoserine lactone acylase PvdQ
MTHDPKLRAALLGAALSAAALVAAMYAFRASHGTLPASHPWGAIALLAGSGNLALHAVRPPHVPAESPRYLVAGAGLLAAVVALLAARGM